MLRRTLPSARMWQNLCARVAHFADMGCQPWGDTRASLRLLFTANLLVSHSDSSIIEGSGFLFHGKREDGEKQTAGAATQTVCGMASSTEDAQTTCMGEIQTDSLPLSQATEEHPIQQDQSCSEGDFTTQVNPDLQEQPQEEHEQSEQPQEPLKLEEELQDLDPVPAFECVPTNTEGISLELCWYCTKSLPIEELNMHQLHLEKEALTLPNAGEHLSYNKDPRPHFGVARSSHSIPFPLWDSEGPKEMKREADEDSFTSCPHCNLLLPLHTLRWHEEKCLLFEGPRKDV